MAGGGLTPEQKWRAEAIPWLYKHSNKTLIEIDRMSNYDIIKMLKDIYISSNYLIMEYIVNVKTD